MLISLSLIADELKELMMEGQSERSNRNAQPSPSLKQPAQPSIHNPPVAKSVPGFLFSEEQMVRILQQQSQNMQILLQAFLLERELHGAKTAEGCHWWQQIVLIHSLISNVVGRIVFASKKGRCCLWRTKFLPFSQNPRIGSSPCDCSSSTTTRA